MIDCDSLPGHWGNICRGTHRKANGKPHTLAERVKLVSLKLRINESEVELPAAPHVARDDQPRRKATTPSRPSSGIGDRLHAIILRETGAAIECSECRNEINKLNQQSVNEVRAERDQLAKRIATRARTKAPKWWQRWGAALAPGLARERVAGWIDEACGPVAVPVVTPLPIGRIAVAVRTAPRVEPTLDATVESLLAAGFEPPIIFDETTPPRGSFRSFIDHAKTMLDETDATWFLLCEDDVQFAMGLADHLRSLPLPDGIVTLFKPHGLRLDGEGLKPISRVNGSLALLIHRNHLTRIIESRTASKWPKKDCVDRFLTDSARECGIRILSPCRSLIQHTGRTSVCQPVRWITNSLTHRMRHASDFVEAIPSAELVTLITPTGDRQEAFKLCERWVKQQHYTGPIQWIVVDDGAAPTTVTMGQEYVRRRRGKERHSLCVNLLAALPLIRGQHVIIIEDDDYYGPDYVSMMVGKLQHADLVGEFGAKYYYIRHRSWRHRTTEQHASLCRSGFNANVLHTLKGCCSGHPSVDLRLWERWTGSKASWVDHAGTARGCVGIKGVDGRQSSGWRPAKDSRDDTDFSQLRLWIGDDWTAYRDLWNSFGSFRDVATDEPLTGRRLIITIATGPKFRELLDVTAPSLRRYAERIGADFVALTDTTQSWWGLEKFRVHKYAKQYERTLFVDADVIVREGCPDVFSLVPVGSVGLHQDYPHLVQDHWLKTEWSAVMASQGVSRAMPESSCLNTGLVVCDRSTAHIWEPPPRRLPGQHCDEQLWIESTIRTFGVPVVELHSSLNCQWWFRDFAKREPLSSVVHLANAPHNERVRLAKSFSRQ